MPRDSKALIVPSWTTIAEVDGRAVAAVFCALGLTTRESRRLAAGCFFGFIPMLAKPTSDQANSRHQRASRPEFQA